VPQSLLLAISHRSCDESLGEKRGLEAQSSEQVVPELESLHSKRLRAEIGSVRDVFINNWLTDRLFACNTSVRPMWFKTYIVCAGGRVQEGKGLSGGRASVTLLRGGTQERRSIILTSPNLKVPPQKRRGRKKGKGKEIQDLIS
jgi:hypothetical protein